MWLQVMLAVLRRSGSPGEAAAAGAAAFTEAQAGVARISEAEKAFTSRVRPVLCTYNGRSESMFGSLSPGRERM